MESLDNELMEEIRNRALRTKELKDLNVKPDGLKQQMRFDLNYIKTICREEEWPHKPYFEVYYNIFYGGKG